MLANVSIYLSTIVSIYLSAIAFKFPDDKKYKPSEFKSVVEVSNEVEKVVRDGFDLMVLPAGDTPSFAGLGGDEIPAEQVADLIAQPTTFSR